jgi:hypothetical protein
MTLHLLQEQKGELRTARCGETFKERGHTTGWTSQVTCVPCLDTQRVKPAQYESLTQPRRRIIRRRRR